MYTSPTPLPSEMEGLWMISKAPYSARKYAQSMSAWKVNGFIEKRRAANLNHFHPVACLTIVHFCDMSLHVPLLLALPCACSPFSSPPRFLCVLITALDFAKGGFKWTLLGAL